MAISKFTGFVPGVARPPSHPAFLSPSPGPGRPILRTETVSITPVVAVFDLRVTR